MKCEAYTLILERNQLRIEIENFDKTADTDSEFHVFLYFLLKILLFPESGF